MRVLIAGVLGGIALFIWGALAHTALPLGELDMHLGKPHQAVLEGLQAAGGEPGIYMLPSPTNVQMQDEAAMTAFAEANRGSAYAFVVYQPGGNPSLFDMGPTLGIQFATDVLSAIVLAWILALVPLSLGKRLGLAAAIGLFGWMAISLPYWNWYMFPLGFTLGGLVEQVVGSVLAGAASAWWLGRGEK